MAVILQHKQDMAYNFEQSRCLFKKQNTHVHYMYTFTESLPHYVNIITDRETNTFENIVMLKNVVSYHKKCKHIFLPTSFHIARCVAKNPSRIAFNTWLSSSLQNAF